MTTTRYLATEADIKKSHPEAVRVENSLVLRQLPETDEEIMQAMLAGETAHSGQVRRRADGSVIKYGEKE